MRGRTGLIAAGLVAGAALVVTMVAAGASGNPAITATAASEAAPEAAPAASPAKTPASPSALPAPLPVTIDVQGANGVGRANPGLPCGSAAGADGDSWHYGYEAPLAAGKFTSLPAQLRMNLDVHADSTGGGVGANGFLQGSESTVSVVNERGTVVLRLADGGSCTKRTATVDGTSASATTAGDWWVESGSGSYAGLTGSGQFNVEAGIAPGADNPWHLRLTGSVTLGAGPPILQASVGAINWGTLGLDRITRTPTVQVTFTNTGADAYGTQLTSAPSPTPGATFLAGAPARIGDLLSSGSSTVTLQYRLALLGPCTLVITECRFDITLSTAMVDALDRPITDVDTVHVEERLIGATQ